MVDCQYTSQQFHNPATFSHPVNLLQPLPLFFKPRSQKKPSDQRKATASCIVILFQKFPIFLLAKADRSSQKFNFQLAIIWSRTGSSLMQIKPLHWDGRKRNQLLEMGRWVYVGGTIVGVGAWGNSRQQSGLCDWSRQQCG